MVGFGVAPMVVTGAMAGVFVITADAGGDGMCRHGRATGHWRHRPWLTRCHGNPFDDPPRSGE
jgi:hypothetical protein